MKCFPLLDVRRDHKCIQGKRNYSNEIYPNGSKGSCGKVDQLSSEGHIHLDEQRQHDKGIDYHAVDTRRWPEDLQCEGTMEAIHYKEVTPCECRLCRIIWCLRADISNE